MSKYPTTRRSHIYRRSHPSLRRISVDPWSRLPKDTILHSYDTIIGASITRAIDHFDGTEFAIFFLSRSSLDVTRKQLLSRLLRAFRLFAHAKSFIYSLVCSRKIAHDWFYDSNWNGDQSPVGSISRRPSNQTTMLKSRSCGEQDRGQARVVFCCWDFYHASLRSRFFLLVLLSCYF